MVFKYCEIFRVYTLTSASFLALRYTDRSSRKILTVDQLKKIFPIPVLWLAHFFKFMWIISLYEAWKDVDNDAAKMHSEVPKLKMLFKCQNSNVIVTPAGETGSPEQVQVLLGKPIFCSMVKSVAQLEILAWPSWSQPARLVMCEMDPSSRRLAGDYRVKWDLAMSLNLQHKLREISGSTLGWGEGLEVGCRRYSL